MPKKKEERFILKPAINCSLYFFLSQSMHITISSLCLIIVIFQTLLNHQKKKFHLFFFSAFIKATLKLTALFEFFSYLFSSNQKKVTDSIKKAKKSLFYLNITLQAAVNHKFSRAMLITATLLFVKSLKKLLNLSFEF